MGYFTYRYWTSDTKIRAILSRYEYETETVVCFLKREFGYKNGKEIKEDLKVNSGFLNAILAYKEEEEPTLIDWMGALLNKLRSEKAIPRYCAGVCALDINIFDRNDRDEYWKYTVRNKFEMYRRFKQIIDELLDGPNVYND